jgi:glycosyltransferase involved in cell wall biosynthesis
MITKKHILISTGIYPPKIGGPAQYAKNLKEAFEKINYTVAVKTFSFEDNLPSGLRHLFFLVKIVSEVLKSDVVFILDTFSAGLPTVFACKLLGRKSVIRTGGDFLWEQYVERTGRKVLLSNFYQTEIGNFSFKDRVVFRLIKWTLRNTSRVIFSTEWQRDIFIGAYGLKKEKTFIVENYYGPKEESFEPDSQLFIASSRELVLKNTGLLKNIFNKIKKQHGEVNLFTDKLPFPDFVQKIKNSYAVIQISLGDISPNLILDAIRFNKPFICTKEIGILERIKDVGIFVDPLNEKEIEEAVLRMLNKDEYEKAVEKVRNFSFLHTWDDIASEFLEVALN